MNITQNTAKNTCVAKHAERRIGIMFMHANKEDIAAGMIAGVILGTAVGVAAKAMCDCGKKSYTQKLMEDVKKSTAKLLGCMK